MIYAGHDTLAFWERLDAKERSRTLASARFIHFPNDRDDKEWRRRNSEAIRDGATKPIEKLTAWRSFVLALADNNLQSEKLLFARLQSRLMVNMAGGVFENGGLCLDRTSGVVFIPGSAVKGCARRVALAALREWSETEQKPSGEDNPLAIVAKNFDSRRSLLASIALIFGWSDQEWTIDSDFAWAWGCDEKPTDEQKAAWKEGRQVVSSALCNHLGITLKESDVQNPWKKLPNFAGTIAFLPAYPWNTNPAIELDVITGHHRAYYESSDQNAIAYDTEEPIPVIFPAVSAKDQPRFAFVLHPTARARKDDLTHARGWLAEGLDIFGIGAKTNAGYGWFIAEDRMEQADSADKTRLLAMEILANESAQRETVRIELEEAAAQAGKLQAEADRLADLKKKEDAMTAEQWAEDYAKMDDQTFATQAKSFETMRAAQRRGFLLVLASAARKDTRRRWKDGKQKETFKMWQGFAATLTPPITL